MSNSFVSIDTNDPVLFDWMRLTQSEGLGRVETRSWATDASDLSLLAGLGTVVQERVSDDRTHIIIRLGRMLVRVFHLSLRGSVTVFVASSVDDTAVESVFQTIRHFLPESNTEHEVPVVYWHFDRHENKPSTSRRKIKAPAWDEVRANYAALSLKRLEPLFEGFEPGRSGQLLLWHGRPGTGKTWCLRALARAWKSWCSIEYITDPDSFLGSADYMVDVLLSSTTCGHLPQPPDDQWRLLILEDTGELLAADAKLREGQKLSRLLNIVDGFIGQGLRVLVLVTTNEELRHLHPAVVRPGRCASLVEFLPLSKPEVERWLARHDASGQAAPTVVADLYAMLGEQPVAQPARPPVGFEARR